VQCALPRRGPLAAPVPHRYRVDRRPAPLRGRAPDDAGGRWDPRTPVGAVRRST